MSLMGIHDDWLPASGHTLNPFQAQVYSISRAIVVSSSGIVGLADGTLIEDTLDHTHPTRDGYEIESESVIGLPEPETELPGRYISLLLGGHENHFHWLIMNLSRVAILNDQDTRDIAGILVPEPLSPIHFEALFLAGVTAIAPLRPVRKTESLSVQTLVLPWNVASGYGVNPSCAKFLHGLVPRLPSRSGGRRIYIDRRMSPTRSLLNEDEVIAALSRLGIEPVRVEGMSLKGQARLMQQAGLVVGPHGAGLANLAFAAPGTKVIELMPSGVMNWAYRYLCAACRHEYDCVVGISQPRNGVAPIWAPWSVSPTHVLSAVSEMLEPSAG